MQRYRINVLEGTVTNIKVTLSSLGQGYATQEFTTFIKGDFFLLNKFSYSKNVFYMFLRLYL